MAGASAFSFLFDGLTALHGGPLDDASGFVFYRELYGHLDGRLKDLGIDLFGRMLAWVIATATVLLTLWVWIEGYRIVVGRSQRSMVAFATEAMQAVTITAVATGSALGGGTLYDWVGHDLGRLVHRVITGQDGDVFEAIDRALGYMQLAFGFIDEIQTGANEALEDDKFRNLSLVALGMGGPAIVAGSLLLLYKAMLALCLGFAPLFVLCLLFPQTKPLFWGWLNHLVGTLFALSVLHVMAAIAMNMICAVAATFWTATLTGASVEGVDSLALQQGGLGLLLTTSVIGAPAIAAKFFKGLLGDFSPYSVFGHAGATRTSTAQVSHPHTHTRAHAYADPGERSQAPVQTHAHRLATPVRTGAQEDKIKPAEDTRSFLERYPNATASLDEPSHKGDALPEGIRASVDPGEFIPKDEPEIIYVKTYNPTNGSFAEISKSDNREGLDRVMAKLNFAGQVLKDHKEQEAIDNFNKMRVIVSSTDSGSHFAYVVPGTKDMVVNLPRFVTKTHDQIIGMFLHEIRHMSKHNTELRNMDIETMKEDCCHPTKSPEEDDAYKYQEKLGYPKK